MRTSLRIAVLSAWPVIREGPVPPALPLTPVWSFMSRRGSGIREIVLLTLGWEDLPRAVSIEGAPSQERMREPVPGILLHADGGWLLLDTGFNTALLHDAALRRRFHGRPTYRAILPGPGEPLEEALSHAGIEISEVSGTDRTSKTPKFWYPSELLSTPSFMLISLLVRVFVCSRRRSLRSGGAAGP